MSKRQYPLIYAKVPACLMHIAAVIIALIGISLMYLNNNFGKGLESLSIESYEDTPGFYEQLRRDVNDIFKYVRYRNVFETDGKIDYTKPMLEMTYGPGDERSYSLNYIVEYTKARGFYLDDQFQVSGTSNANFEPDLEEGYVEWKAYDEIFSGSAETESQNFSSLEELSQEILSLLGEYYSICNRLLNTSSNLYFKIVYSNPGNKDLVYTNAPDLVPEKLRTYGPYIYVSGESAVVNSNLDSSSLNITSLLSAYNPYEDSNSYYMVLAVDTKFPATDSYSIAAAKYQESRKLYLAGCILMAFGLVFSLATIICLMIFSGHKYSKDETITLHGFDNGPTESAFALFFVIAAAGLLLCRQIGVRITHVLLARDSWDYIEQLMYLSVLYLAGLIVGFSLLRRYKARILWSSSLLKRAMEALQIFHLKQTFSAQIIALFVTYSAVNLLIIGGSFYLFSNWLFGSQALQVAIGVAAVLWLALNLWALYMIYRNAVQQDRLASALTRIAEGETNYQVNLDDFPGKGRELAEKINHLSTGLDAALQEKVKSERLKADLITNVSHDIKTPLTSIINYVDLIKREHIQDEKITGYLEVLEQKSQRLKTLTEDLVEASKASSGNLKLEINDIDLVELVQQTNGEFEEKFEMRHLELISTLPDEALVIEADGRRLWRVLENLYNNTFKYALESSRVYVDVFREKTAGEDGELIDMVTFTIKNISTKPLNISPDELTERFVRGDVARTTEGSGLGLSIARSLTELQNGRFKLYIDGDLFKACVSFPIKKQA